MSGDHHHILDMENDGENYFLWLYDERYVIRRFDVDYTERDWTFRDNVFRDHYDPYPRTLRIQMLHAPLPVPEPMRRSRLDLGLRRPQ